VGTGQQNCLLILFVRGLSQISKPFGQVRYLKLNRSPYSGCCSNITQPNMTGSLVNGDTGVKGKSILTWLSARSFIIAMIV